MKTEDHLISEIKYLQGRLDRSMGLEQKSEEKAYITGYEYQQELEVKLINKLLEGIE